MSHHEPAPSKTSRPLGILFRAALLGAVSFGGFQFGPRLFRTDAFSQEVQSGAVTPLSAQVRQAIADHIGNQLRANADDDSRPVWPEGVSEQSYAIYVGLRAGGRLLADGWSDEARLPESLSAALERARAGLRKKTIGTVDTVEVDLGYNFEPVDTAHQPARPSDDFRGVKGLQLQSGEAKELLAPTTMLARNKSFR